MMDEIAAEDAKIVTLARATRARSGSSEGAAVRDLDGRTYTAAAVTLPSVSLTALQLAVAMAASSGAAGLEAAAVVTDNVEKADASGAIVDLSPTRDLGGTNVPVFVADSRGKVIAKLST
jgi:hypothetical protein